MRYVFNFHPDGVVTVNGIGIADDRDTYTNTGTWLAIGGGLWVTYGSPPAMTAAYAMTPEGLSITADGKTILFTKAD